MGKNFSTKDLRRGLGGIGNNIKCKYYRRNGKNHHLNVVKLY